MDVDRRAFLASVGGVAAVELMSPEDRAEAVEHFMSEELDAWSVNELSDLSELGQAGQQASGRLGEQDGPQLARGTGRVFRPREEPLAPMPEKPTLIDFFKFRFAPAQHVMRSATYAMQEGHPERTVMACLLHDVAQALVRPDHGWWRGALFERGFLDFHDTDERGDDRLVDPLRASFLDDLCGQGGEHHWRRDDRVRPDRLAPPPNLQSLRPPRPIAPVVACARPPLLSSRRSAPQTSAARNPGAQMTRLVRP